MEVDTRVVCPACHAEQGHEEAYLGNLGGAEWFRCRNCGSIFTPSPDEPAEETEKGGE